MRIWRDAAERWQEVKPGVSRRILSQEGFSALALFIFKPNSTFEPHEAREKHFGLFVKGRGAFDTPGGQVNVQEGDAFFIEPGEVHGFTNTSNVDAIVLEVFVPPTQSHLTHAQQPDLHF